MAKKTRKQKLIDKCEQLCREIVGNRDGWQCAKCGKTSPLDYNHVIGRAQSVRLRWLPANGQMLCKGCHLGWWHQSPVEPGEWFAKNYPQRWLFLQSEKQIKEPLRIQYWEDLLAELEGML